MHLFCVVANSVPCLRWEKVILWNYKKIYGEKWEKVIDNPVLSIYILGNNWELLILCKQKGV
ncbi:MAG: hypothetical protein K2P44_04805, partial [Lachnospiraceae bacterium]|nr:hypothetical protein [Lachnospiraceae bacterium]